MKELINIKPSVIGGVQVHAVSGRELHFVLENRDHFSAWIKDRIEQYGFVENQDFATYSESSEKGRPRLEYAISVDMAKELAMVERNDMGKRARQYFIECERQLRDQAEESSARMIPQTLPEALRLAADLSEKNLALEAKVATDAPKVEALDRISTADGAISVREAAGTLKVPERKFVQWLISHDWMYRRPGSGKLLAYHDKQRAGYLIHRVSAVVDSVSGETKLKEQAMVTASGVARLAEIVDIFVPSGTTVPRQQSIPLSGMIQ